MAEKVTKVVAYTADSLNTLSDLETSCERDEGRLGKIIKIERATLEEATGKKAVAVTYEKVSLPTDINIGKLTFLSFANPGDKNTKLTQLRLAQATPVLPGDNPSAENSVAKVFIGTQTFDILVFRDKAAN